jgi:hypothetical protein
MSPGVNDSVLVENKYVTKSKGKIDPNNTNSRASAFASDSCIYFSIYTLDTFYINEKPIFNPYSDGYAIILKYNPLKDTIIIIKEIFVTEAYSYVSVGEFKEFDGRLFCTLEFQGTYELNG